MDYHEEQYAQLKANLMESITLQEFEIRLNNSEISENQSYLGLLLMHIIRLKQPKIQDYLKILIQKGANVNFTEPKESLSGLQSGKSIFMLACEKGSLKSVLFLLKQQHLDVGAEDSCGENALFYALQNEEDNAVNVILSILADFPHLVNSVSRKRDKSLLTVSAEKGYLKIVEILLKKSADPNYQSEISGNTILHQLIKNDSLPSKILQELIVFLLKYKIDPNLENYQCQTAKDIADTYLFDFEGIVKEYHRRQFEEKQIKIESQSINAITKDEQNLSDSFMNFEDGSQFSFTNSENSEKEEVMDVERLGMEIWEHSIKYEAIHQAAWNEISNFVNEVALIGQNFDLTLQIIGSFATGLWTPHSDIDLTFINRNMMYVNITNLLKEVHIIMKRNMKNLGIYEIYLNDQLKFPNIKIQLCSKLNNRKIDLTIFQKKNNARKYVQYIQNSLSLNQFIKPLFFTIHKLLQNFQLHKPTKSGLKTYTIFLMIVLVAEQYPVYDIGQFFMNFIEYYTNYYNYEEMILENGQVQKRLNIMDPLNNINNVGGKDTNIERLQTMLKTVFYGMKTGNKPLDYLFQLHNIFEQGY